MTTRRITAIAVSVVAAAVGIVAPTVHAGFTPRTPIVTAQTALTDIDPVAVSGAGVTTVVWSQDDATGNRSVKARRVSAAGIPGPVIDVTPPGENTYRPAVATTPAGRSFVAWGQSAGLGDPAGVKGRFVEADGSLGPVLTLRDGSVNDNAQDIQVLMAPDGTANVVWRNSALPTLPARRVSPAGELSDFESDLSGGGSIDGPRAQVLPDGAIVVAWRGTSGVRLNTLSPDGTPGSPVTLSSGLASEADPEIAVDSSGDGLVVWRAQLSSPTRYTVLARRLDSTGAPAGIQFVVEPAGSQFIGLSVRVAADSQDDFMVTWDRQDGAGGSAAWARRLDAGGTFAGSAQAVSAGGVARGAVPVLEDRGSGAVGWYVENGSDLVGTQGRTVDAAAAPVGAKVDLLAGSNDLRAASAPAIGLAALVSSAPASPSTRAIVLSRYMVPPVCAPAQAKVAQGRPIEVPSACAGLGIERVLVSAPPKHGKVVVVGTRFRYTPAPGYAGPDSFSYRGVNDGGASSPVKVQVAVGKDTVAPVVTGLVLKTRKPAGKKRTFRFVLRYSERSTATVTVKKRGKDGKFKTTVGTLAATKPGLTSSVPVKGAVLKALRKGGRFRAIAVARDAAGNLSAKRKLKIKR